VAAYKDPATLKEARSDLKLVRRRQLPEFRKLVGDE
jgi:hypothetical protein